MSIELPRVLTPAITAQLGISRGRIRSEIKRGNWRRFERGAVLTRPEEPQRADWAAVAIALAGPSAGLSGWDAVRLYGLGEDQPPAPEVLVLSRSSDNRCVGPARIRRTARPYRTWLTPADAEPYGLMPITHPARVVCDTALQLRSLRSTQALVSSALQRRRCSVDELMSEWAATPRRDSRFLRLALADAVTGARSVAEIDCSRRLTRPGIPSFELNAEVRDASGVMFVDVYWRSLRAVLEVESRAYHFAQEDWQRTLARHNRLNALGLSVAHYPPAVISGRNDSWLREVSEWLRRRAVELNVPWPPGSGPITLTAL